MQEIASAVKECLTHQTENGQIDLDTGQAFTNAVLKFAEVGYFCSSTETSTAVTLHVRNGEWPNSRTKEIEECAVSGQIASYTTRTCC